MLRPISFQNLEWIDPSNLNPPNVKIIKSSNQAPVLEQQVLCIQMCSLLKYQLMLWWFIADFAVFGYILLIHSYISTGSIFPVLIVVVAINVSLISL